MIPRRRFLKLAAASPLLSLAQNQRIGIVVDAAGPIHWAAGQLRRAIIDKGSTAEIFHSEQPAANCTRLIVARPGCFVKPETTQLSPGQLNGVPTCFVSASDSQGFVYGLLELTERVKFGSNVSAALELAAVEEESSLNEVRSVARAFCSEIEDKSWYYDKDFWQGYLDVLAASRFNRFNLAFGFGYDFPRGVTGDYFHFVYPYMVEVPGYDVRVVPLNPGEREKNFEILRFVAAETARRGMQFQLGIWTHAYQWTDSPHADHHIEGLTSENHAAYCRDALAIILKTCPEITGLTMRVHGESGIPEGSYPFWRTLFEAISGCGRKIEVDMHSKGVNQIMIDMANNTGMPVKLSAKYSAEHQSLGYHQADIRELEIPKAGRMESGLFSVSNGERRFTRYGYADFFQEGARAKVLFRLWPGTQRHLISADPEMAADFSRTSHMCGAAGLELCEPLTFKGREGSGLPGGRCAYADPSLNPKQDWQKFELYYRVWGRRLYNPDADPETWRRYLRTDFGSSAVSVETAVSHASRILALITSAHLPSASNHSFWPEIYTNMPIVLGSERSPYSDTPDPKCFGTVSPLDPELFSTIVEHAADLLAGRPNNPKYSPVEVAQWIDDLVASSSQALQAVRQHSSKFRRVEEDVLIQQGLGKFFAAKLRSGVFFEVFQQTGDPAAGKQALDQYRQAREAWAAMAQRAQKVYDANITYGNVPIRQGHWLDRLPSIDKDIAAMQSTIETKPKTANAPAQIMQITRRPSVPCNHTAPQVFHPGAELSLTLSSAAPSAVRLHYRHVDQAERWLSVDMEKSHNSFRSAIPAAYTNSAYPLQYYFELQRGSSEVWLYPGFNATLSNQPYFVVYRRT